ncbi:hypothetical protein AURDEDRAFT_160249 [Auricularia subglabra TFB-10046 SS5]|nr:hypothetical protein AURDEDRAFT_160249 [Auricularia subglabra TFB-10046 SS5]
MARVPAPLHVENELLGFPEQARNSLVVLELSARELPGSDIVELLTVPLLVARHEEASHPDAQGEDMDANPVSKCRGYGEFGAQWWAMPKAFPVSRHLSPRILTATERRIEFAQAQEYTFRWVGKMSTTGGMVRQIPPITEMLRRLNAKTFPWIVHVPKDKEYQ